MNDGDLKIPMPEEAIESIAASWLAQREEGFTPEQEAEFLRWRLADPRHGAAVDRLEEACAILEQLPLLRGDPRIEKPAGSGGDGHREFPDAKPENGPAAIRRWAWAALGAAAASVVVWLAVDQLAAGAPEVASFSAPAKSYRRVLLPDSSVAQLNGGTHLNIVYSKKERLVHLDEGEAHFNVAKDAARPFVVTAQNVHVIAVGTAFNVRISGDSVDVLVTEGVVRIERDGEKPGDVVVAAGERALLGRGSPGLVSRADVEQTREALAWRQPQMAFIEAPLAEVVKRFNELNAVRLEIGDPAIAGRVVGGTFPIDDVETFIRVLEAGGEFVVERKSDGTVVVRAAR
jgi:transmembrane sensor